MTKAGTRLAGRAAATLVVAAPLAWACALFASDLHERPPGRHAVAILGGTRLTRDDTVRIPLAPDSIPYRALALRIEVAAPASLTLRLCGRSQCVERSMGIPEADVATMPIPDPGPAHELTLSLTALSGGPISLRPEPAIPAVEVTQGYSWRLPARRARRIFRAMAGGDWFAAALAACALALAAGLVACCAFASGPVDAP